MNNLNLEELKSIIGKEHLYIGNLALFHAVIDFLGIKNNSLMNVHSLWRKIQYRINKIIKEDNSFVKGYIRSNTYWGKQSREINHTAYWIREKNK